MKKQNNVFKRIALCVMIALSIIATFTKIFTGFDIDEAYALALPYRGLQGDRLFADMWEVHQTSYIIPFLFIKLYSLFVPSMEYLVVYMRTVASVIHAGMALILYLACKQMKAIKQSGTEDFVPAIMALIYYNFMPKWMIDLDFSMLQLWFFTLFVICFIKGMKQIKKYDRYYLLVAGLMLAAAVLAYPGMVLLFVGAMILIIAAYYKRDKNDRSAKSFWQEILLLTAGCAIPAIVFFVYIFSYMSLSELIAAIPKVFMDGAHQYDFATKMGLYLSQWLEVLRQTLILTVPALFCSVFIYWLMAKLRVKYSVLVKSGKTQAEQVRQISFGMLFCIIFEIEVAVLISIAGFFTSWGPFRLQVRYIIQFIMAICLLKSLKKEQSDVVVIKELSYIWWLSFIAFVGILVASNVGPTSSASYLVIGNLLFVAMTIFVGKCQGKLAEGLAYIGAIVFVISLIMCKGYYLRVTEYVPGDIADGLVKVQEGPLAGIYVLKDDQIRLTSDYKTIRQNTTETDRVLFMGTESMGNIYANGKIVSPTTISTPAFNEQWVDYFEMYSEKMPTVIFLAKNTVDNREKFFNKNPFGIWIASHYDVECMEETDSLCIIREK